MSSYRDYIPFIPSIVIIFGILIFKWYIFYKNDCKNGKWYIIQGLRLVPMSLVAFGVPLGLLFYGINRGGILTFLAGFLIVLGIIVIGIQIILIDKEEFLDFKAECKFMFLHATTAWTVGGGLACFLTGGYLLFVSTGGLHDHYNTGLSIYMGIIGATLAVHAFYRHTAPIIEMNFLLRRLVDDLKNAGVDDRLWIIYPAMNIGYYRNREDSTGDLPSNHIYNQFKTELGNCAKRLKSNATALTYPRDLYELLFECYIKHLQNNKLKNGKPKTDNEINCIITACVTEAGECLEEFVAHEGYYKYKIEKYGKHVEVMPREFPQHMIIIGHVVYSIMSYGLPLYKPDMKNPDNEKSKEFHGRFEPIEHEKKPVSLLVYRREDATLAESLDEHLKRFIEHIESEQSKYEQKIQI